MMNIDLRLRIILIVSTLAFFLFILRIIKKDKISIDIATIWVLFSLSLVILALFPEIMTVLSDILGIKSQLNALYTSLIFELLVISFYALKKLSALEKKLNDLVIKEAINNKNNCDKKDH